MAPSTPIARGWGGFKPVTLVFRTPPCGPTGALHLRGELQLQGLVPGSSPGSRGDLVLRSSAWPLSPACFGTVRRAAQCCGLREVGENEEWTVYWTDSSVSLERVMEMKRFQKINHFPGMIEICRKDLLARNLNRMLKLFPKEYKIFPHTWCLPADYGDFRAYACTRKKQVFICKPDSGCQGKGIFITHNPEDIKHGEHMICQQYISKEGLVRFATMRYIDPSSRKPVKKGSCQRSHTVSDDICMHLTNYAINKRNENFVQHDTMGSKRKLSTLNAWMTENSYNTTKLWEDVEDIIIKTLISAHPVLKHNYQSCFPNHTSGCACFEILGFDILLDRKLKPWLLEVNHSPSFSTDSHLDREVKDALLCDTINLINVNACNKRKVLEEDKQRVKERLLQSHQTSHASRREELQSSQEAWLCQAQQYEDAHLGGYRRIYPAHGTQRYELFFKHSGSLFQETASSKAREECARQQLEEIRLKKEKFEAAIMKKKAERKEELHGESAGDKPRTRTTSTAPSARLTSRSSRIWDRKAQHAQVDSTQPQDIVANEEKKRVNALLQRENLIRSLGIIDQLSRLLPATETPADMQRSFPSDCKSQPQCHRDALGGFATLVPFSPLRHPLFSSGQQHPHNPRAEAQLPPSLGSGSAPALLVRGKRIPYTARQSLRSPNRGWLRGQAAPAAAVTRPCSEPEGQQERGQQLPAAGSKAEGCEAGRLSFSAGGWHPGSLASTGRDTRNGIFGHAAILELPISPDSHGTGPSPVRKVKSTGNRADGTPRSAFRSARLPWSRG
ncbi:tubulin polyglutamylase TTLL13 isoform 2-T2 [Guaruba guarouba]